jgi:hypothetical protein
VLFFSVRGDLTAFAVQFEFVTMSQLRDGPFILLGLSLPQLVIEVNYGKNNADFLTQVEKQTEQSDRVRSA